MNIKDLMPLDKQLDWQICSETNLTLLFPKPITLENQQKCWALAETIDQLPNVLEVIIGMNTVSVFTQQICFKDLMVLQDKLTELSSRITPKKIQGKHIEIPVNYGGKFGPDLRSMATELGVSTETIVEQHTSATYTVYFIGFQPGFPYLGGLSESLYFPRHTNPRTEVPAGSVGIGGEQTGIYPFSSPGGWQLLGQTETQLFDLKNKSPTLLKAGDTLKFTSVGIFD